ncbi:hypothetical protein QOT17_021434 [Balamuthia mandrillaris]
MPPGVPRPWDQFVNILQRSSGAEGAAMAWLEELHPYLPLSLAEQQQQQEEEDAGVASNNHYGGSGTARFSSGSNHAVPSVGLADFGVFLDYLCQYSCCSPCRAAPQVSRRERRIHRLPHIVQRNLLSFLCCYGERLPAALLASFWAKAFGGGGGGPGARPVSGGGEFVGEQALLQPKTWLLCLATRLKEQLLHRDPSLKQVLVEEEEEEEAIDYVASWSAESRSGLERAIAMSCLSPPTLAEDFQFPKDVIDLLPELAKYSPELMQVLEAHSQKAEPTQSVGQPEEERVEEQKIIVISGRKEKGKEKLGIQPSNELNKPTTSTMEIPVTEAEGSVISLSEGLPLQQIEASEGDTRTTVDMLDTKTEEEIAQVKLMIDNLDTAMLQAQSLATPEAKRLLTLLNESQLDVVCEKLSLSAATEEILAYVTNLYLLLSEPSYYKSLEYLRCCILPKIRSLESAASRSLSAMMVAIAQKHPAATIDALLVPLVLDYDSFALPQSAIVNKVLKECLSPTQVHTFLKNFLSSADKQSAAAELDTSFSQSQEMEATQGSIITADAISPWTDQTIMILQNVLAMKQMQCSQDTIALLLEQLAKHVVPLAKSTKLTALILLLVTNHFEQVQPHKAFLERIAHQLDNFMKKNLLAKISQL